MSELTPRDTRGLHPFLFAVWPVLDLYARHVSVIDAVSVLWSLLVVLAVTGTIYAICWAALKRTEAASLMTTGFVLPFFLYGALWDIIESVGRRLHFLPAAENDVFVRHAALILALVIAVAILERWFATTRCSLRGVARAANVTGAILVLFAAVRIANAHWDLGSHDVSEDHLAREHHRPNDMPQNAEPLPDIYYLIFDRYANATTLKESYGFDNGPFVNRLENSGFYVAGASRCNYPLSLLSLSSSLNMQYHEPLDTMSNVEARLPRSHEVGRILKDHGYRYIHVWGPYLPTSSCRIAEINLRPDSGISRSTAEFSFPLALLRMTPIVVFFKETIDTTAARQHAEAALWQFETLRSLPAEPGPKFVFAHILLPHPPLAFSDNGLRWGPPEPSGSKQGYLEQLQYTNTQIGELVDELMRESATPPIIVLQADEGPYLREDDLDKSAVKQRGIRMGILNAYHVPATVRSSLYPEISPVNTFRLVLSKLLGAEMELIEDRHFTWPDLLGAEDAEDLDDLKAKRIAFEGWEFPEPSDDMPFQFRDVTHQ